MRILALDSSGLVASVAIMQDDTLLGEYTTNHKKTHSQTLLPMLAQLMEELQLEMRDIDAIAVAGGPGSFTGLRIGSATAKGLGLAADLPLIHVPTLEGLAYNLWGTDAYVCPLMDARRNQVYTGVYYFEEDADQKAKKGGMKMLTKIDQCAVGIDEIIAKLNQIYENEEASDRQKKVVFLGDGVPVFSNYI
ncbi:MAG: tRNA (adenosine(37)-N6)-threonylcarbamoyltransferase complex dimerization subunit type 1 TsaB, partial [Eubacterium sp.]|nr:tRNA (adenosine(37)-N6)-threonylcarbamoyltransferase complex dimerization subunit type 1 TsaB [Eubacterium sp.]